MSGLPDAVKTRQIFAKADDSGALARGSNRKFGGVSRRSRTAADRSETASVAALLGRADGHGPEHTDKIGGGDRRYGKLQPCW